MVLRNGDAERSLHGQMLWPVTSAPKQVGFASSHLWMKLKTRRWEDKFPKSMWIALYDCLLAQRNSK